jgi:predicted nucleotidyltransferase
MPPLLDPRLVETVAALTNGLEHASVRYCLIGALVPELLLKTPPSQRTNDADVVVLVETLDEFDRVKRVLEQPQYGFMRTPHPFRMDRGPGRIDVVPYSKRLAPDEEDSDRLYGVESEGALLDFEVAGAHLLGLDGRPLVDDALATTIRPILVALADPESSLGFSTAREHRSGWLDERLRVLTARLFEAYRTGLGV